MPRCRSFLPDLMTVRAVMVSAALEKKKKEDVHKEYVKKFGEDPLTEKGEQRYRRVLGQLAWAALSRADLSFPISFLSRFQAKPNPAAEQCMRVFLKWIFLKWVSEMVDSKVVDCPTDLS